MITLHYNNTTLQVQEDDSSFRYRAIMGDNSVTLKFSLPDAIDFPVGTYIEFENARYTLTSPEKWNRHGNENIEYTLVLEGVQASLKKYKLRNQQDGRLKFGMNATPAEFLQLIIANLNQAGRETGWTGVCNITAENKTVEFNHDYLSSALTAIAEAFETEYEITDAKVIRLGKVEYNKSTPLPLAHGKGNGFKPGSGRANSSDSRPVEILYVQGGERNIDRSKYGASELHLPKNGQLTYEGIVYESDADGLFIKRADVAPVYGNEDSFDGSEIYPKRVGEVSSVIVKDAARHFYDFTDSSIPAALDYNAQLIAGDTMTVIFQTGMLAGKEFEISKYDHASRRFEIVPQEIDGIAMPDDTWKPVAGDKYAIFGCTLPDSYINDAQNQTGAEWDLFREAARYLYDNKDFKFTFAGELQGKWARENWVQGLAVASKLVIGGYVRFTDAYFAPNGVDIRIVGVKTFLSDPYAPTIEISNSIASASTFSSELRKPDAQDVKIERGYRDSISFTKRRWRDANETMTMLEQSLLANFTSRISPIAVNTMQLLVGDESLQFVFVDSKTAPQSVVAHTETWNNTTKTFTMGAGILKHMTLGISEIAGEGTHALSDYKYWDIPANSFNLASAGLGEKSYYLYAKCSKTGTTGTFVASETPIAMEAVSGYYHFLVGMLNSEYEGDRSYVPMYGFTEVLPGRITTDKIVSGQGTTFWDLVQNILNLGGKLQYNTQESGAGNLLLKGTLIQTGSGEPVAISAYCGDYDGTRIYQLGDIVTYTDGSVTSTYRYVNSVASSGHLPTDANYWKVEAAGSGTPGADGYNQGTITLYKRSATPVTAITWSDTLYYNFSTNSLESTPSGWSRDIPSGTDPVYATAASFASRENRVAIAANQWATPVEAFKNGEDGQDGEDGLPGAPGSPGIDGIDGQDGLNTASVMLYKRAATQPSLPSNNLTYTFASGVLSGELDGWQQYIPDTDGNPCWITLATAINANATDTILPSEWTRAKKLVEDGADGQDGQDGASVQVQWSADGTSWHTAYTSGDIYMRQKVGDGSWSDAIRVVGENGEQVYTSFVFKAAATQPETPTGTNPIPSGWYDSPPEGEETTISPTYDSNFVTSGTPHTIAIGDNGSVWGRVQFSANAGDIIKVTIRASSERNYDYGYLSPLDDDTQSTSNYAAKVSGTQSSTVSFLIPSTGVHFFYIGYTKDGSQSSNDDTVYVDSVKKITGASLPIWMSSSVVTDGVSDGDWSTPIKITGSDGKGISSAEVKYQGSSSGTTAPTGSWVDNPPSLQPGQYLWTRTITYYTDGSSTTAYSVSRQGEVGPAGKSPAAPFVGTYEQDKLYFGTSVRTDIVYYVNPSTGVGRYYIAKPTAGAGFNVVPTNTAYWDDFGATFDSIATGFAFIQNLIVQRLNTAGEGNNTVKRIVAEGNTLAMYDGVDNTNPRLLITGDDLSGMNQSSSFNFPSNQYPLSYQETYHGGGDVSQQSSGVQFSCLAGAILTVPDTTININVFLDSYSGNEQGTAYVQLRWMVDGEIVQSDIFWGNYGKVGNYSNKSWYEDVTFDGFSMPLTAGQHTIKLAAEVSYGGCQDYAQGTTFVAYVSPTNNTTCSISYGARKTEIGANGFQVAFGSDRMLKCVISGSSTTFLLQSNNAGIEVSSTGSGTGTLRIRIGGTWYTASRNGSGYLVLST